MLILVLGVSVAIFLMTKNPLWPALLPYLVAAWPSVQSAFWLRWNDPWPQRSKTFFWFYLAAGGCKAAGASFFVLAFFVFAAGLFGHDMTLELFSRTILVFMVGAAISTFLGIMGLVQATRRNIRVFVIPNLVYLCGGTQDGVERVAGTYLGINHAIYVVATSIFFPLGVLGALLAGWGFSAHVLGGGIVPQVSSIIGLLMLMPGMLLAIPVYVYFSHRVVAQSPMECWWELFQVEFDDSISDDF